MKRNIVKFILRHPVTNFQPIAANCCSSTLRMKWYLNMTDANKNKPFYHSLRGNMEMDEKILKPVEYMFQCLGKHIVIKLMEAFNYWLKISPDKLQEIEEIIGIVYNACLLYDDIQDNSNLRQGFPVAHSIYGIANTINAANYVSVVGIEKILTLQHPAAVKIFVEELLEWYRGQGMDTYWKDNFICPSEEEYRITAIRKTAWLGNLSIRLMKLFSTYEEDHSSILTTLGLYYQIRDDYCNLCFSEYTKEGYCEDLTEGKFSFPIIHALRSNPDEKQIINILKQKTTDLDKKRYCVELLESYGSLKYTRDVLEELDKTVRTEVECLGGNPLLVKIMDKLKNWNTTDAP